jgi:hypothetical protein
MKGAAGANNLVEDYSYFGRTFRKQVDQQSWASSEKPYQITDTTINSLKVNSVSGKQTTAIVDVSAHDNTVAPRFLITWRLVKEDGQWTLDYQVSGKRID